MAYQSGSVLNWPSCPTFGSRWLLPRLAHLRESCEGLHVNMTTGTLTFLFEDTGYDAAL